jgi:hypothetical protein
MRKLFLTTLLGLGACSHVHMTDDIDDRFDFSILSGPSDQLSTPYVKGTHIRIYANDVPKSHSDWTIESSDPGVLACEDDGLDTNANSDFFSVACVAVSEGSVTMRVLDGDGKSVDEETVRVGTPDRAKLIAHGPLLINGDEQAADVGAARILAGGTATYMVRYYEGSEELHGNGVLGANAPSDITATPETTFLFENREWLQLTTNGVPGTEAITLTADGAALPPINVITVDESALMFVDVQHSSESGVKKGDWLVALAQAYDASSQRIFGVDYHWQVSGQDQESLGDLYRYEFNRSDPQELVAAHGTMGGSTMIHSDAGFVDSTNNIGCQAAPGRRAAGGGALILGLVVVGYGFATRRRMVPTAELASSSAVDLRVGPK